MRWTIFELGPSDIPPIVMIHGTSGTADCFFYQLLSLGYRGYRVISAQFPAYWSVEAWIKGFDAFLNQLKVPKAHLFGASLGGYLCLHYASVYPERVLSLILCNSFVDTIPFKQNDNCIKMFQYAPEFYLKKYILDSFPQASECPEAVDFAVDQVESLTRDELGSRLTLNCIQCPVGEVKIDQDLVTLLETTDEVVLPNSMRERLYAKFPKARQALIKNGGDFPFLSNPSELALHLQVHLRHCGLFPTLKDETKEGKGEADGEETKDSLKQTHFLSLSSDSSSSSSSSDSISSSIQSENIAQAKKVLGTNDPDVHATEL